MPEEHLKATVSPILISGPGFGFDITDHGLVFNPLRFCDFTCKVFNELEFSLVKSLNCVLEIKCILKKK